MHYSALILQHHISFPSTVLLQILIIYQIYAWNILYQLKMPPSAISHRVIANFCDNQAIFSYYFKEVWMR